MKNTKAVPIAGDYEISHIGVLDGIRVLAIGLVVWFHFWQQSWLMPITENVNLDWLVRNGSILVDMMIVLSGFCLFLPYAKEMVYGKKGTKSFFTGQFYIKRAARIMPSYYVAIFVVLFFFALPGKEYLSTTDMWKDLIPHLTFTHNLFETSLLNTKLNGVLWTVGVEMQLYLLFPLMVTCFQKKPWLTYIGMALIGVVSSGFISANFANVEQGFYVNHVLTFFSVFATGMLGAWLYMRVIKDRTRKSWEGIVFTGISLACMAVFYYFCKMRMSYEGGEQKWQVDYRFVLGLLFLIFILSTIFAAKWYRKIWDNRVMKFLAGISFNLYICHQYVAVKLKEFRIPFWGGDTPPNQQANMDTWKWQYTFTCIIVSLLIATAMTYLVEKPAAKLILKKYNQRKKK